MRTAFLNVLSDDAIVFQPGPQNGRKASEAAKNKGGVLQWCPVLAVVAASGDFGYTTGPWMFNKTAEESADASSCATDSSAKAVSAAASERALAAVDGISARVPAAASRERIAAAVAKRSFISLDKTCIWRRLNIKRP
jgi:hypothetical protein